MRRPSGVARGSGTADPPTTAGLSAAYGIDAADPPPTDAWVAPGLGALIRDGRALEEQVVDLAHDTMFDGGRHTGFRILGAGVDQIAQGLAAIEPRTRRTVESVQPTSTFNPHDRTQPLDEASRSRGLTLRFVGSERAFAMNPMLVAMYPHARVGPTVARFILIDRTAAVVGGPPDPRGFPTAWLATRDDVVERVRDLWTRTWARAVPVVPPGEQPPFTRRQFEVARRLALGAKDQAIARELGVSVRTVAADVAGLVAALEARNRVEVVLVLRGGRGDSVAQT
ncbi:helix-turn-helix transcriptional regulator [Intrasporangium flavum]|uniref:helix-turn-helix transcriptional regulator n=1 Tax=Intrasporangium flavum TaxID=1428657 RepID=UPI001A961356|nr:LuxR C-terminal-related transcriptional regulator [Intrasporangium flavum]